MLQDGTAGEVRGRRGGVGRVGAGGGRAGGEAWVHIGRGRGVHIGDIVILLAVDDNKLKVRAEGLESGVVEDGVWSIEDLPGGEEE